MVCALVTDVSIFVMIPGGIWAGLLRMGVLPLNLDGVCRALLGTLTLTIFITLFQI